ncbi:hypothetical protein [Acinetobacter sp. Marseille-Q1618]|uniref:hypothetical protein n=1 Tax=Acinetobacter sp. Marseille-Q1618 TaxID=2697502 RepID=UPI00156DF9A4|nr:hypothetical protein [Acinetobacter sp. Marseille-Q1618]
MKYIFLFLFLIASILAITYEPEVSSKPKIAENTKNNEYRRLWTEITECRGIDPPEGLDKKKYYAYCKCVINPVDSRSREEKKASCLEEMKNPN